MWARFPWGWQAQSCGVAPETPSWRACKPWFWERSLQSQTRIRLSCEVIVGPMHRPGGQIVRNCKSRTSKALALAFVSGLCVHDSLGMQVCSNVSMRVFSSLRILEAPNSMVAFSFEWKSAVFNLRCSPKRDSREGL